MPQDGSKSAPRGLQTAPRGLAELCRLEKTRKNSRKLGLEPCGPQEPLKPRDGCSQGLWSLEMAAPGAPGRLPDGSRSAQDASRTAPRRLQERPRRLQERPKPPRRLDDASKSLQEGQRAPKTCPRGPQEPPMEGHRGLQVPLGRPSAEQGPPHDVATRLSCGQSLPNPAASPAKALSYFACD